MSSEPLIRLNNLGKCYQIYEKPRDRLLQMLCRGRKQYYREFWALKNVGFEVMPGEVVGIVGNNGSGKSTLLQLVCGTLAPTLGDIKIRGRVAALLELGAGFNPEFSGRENVFMNATILGLSQTEIAERYEAIVDFSGIRDFIDQPVKTYSSGMYMRLAFAVATSVDPDILVIDEALSVGDGEFARKSFDRIMDLKNRGKTILFCSHSLYQVEAFCDRALWLEKGTPRALGLVQEVVAAYSDFINRGNQVAVPAPPVASVAALPHGQAARLGAVRAWLGGQEPDQKLVAESRKDDLYIGVQFVADPQLPAPSIGVTVTDTAMRTITSAGSHIDHFAPRRDETGAGELVLCFPKIPFLKGEFFLNVFLLCERGIHIYDQAWAVVRIVVNQSDLEQGVVSIPHEWRHHS
ncbi:MAG: ABC transporter ATP-binding protein [Desulfobulbaceae bacterium]|nr:ABC transporter ATP-binding protein [Desulfobulbaceae bacterium]